MTYQPLARKYRPQSFEEVVGQEITLRAFSNAIEQHRLHPAYLLTGSRGIGKTSLARLFAKCLNCLESMSTKPCNRCTNCVAIRQNQFIDLIEIDAASRTRVEDIQPILDNVQYKPNIGRYKVYLIDEIHMLSTHSFNALLKTLEEPPPHILFILATTDLKRIPDTIVSRCLHFPLNNLAADQIKDKMMQILTLENIAYEKLALQKIADASEGSVRDALSLLEKIILYSEAREVTVVDVNHILGLIDEKGLITLIEAIDARDTHKLTTFMENLSKNCVDFEQMLVSLIHCLHQIALLQFLPKIKNNFSQSLETLAKKIDSEQLQLYYQFALDGRKNLASAPNKRLGLEMILLRMLAFQPNVIHTTVPTFQNEKINNNFQQVPQDTSFSNNESNHSSTPVNTLEEWTHLITALSLTGFIKSLAMHCRIKIFTKEAIYLILDPIQEVLYSEERKNILQQLLSQHFNRAITVFIEIGEVGQLTPAISEEKARVHLKSKKEEQIKNNVYIKELIEQFDAKINPIDLKLGEKP